MASIVEVFDVLGARAPVFLLLFFGGVELMFSFRGTGVPSLLLLFLLHFGERRPGCSEAAHQPPACPSSSHFVDAKSDKGADDVVVGVHFYKMVVVVMVVVMVVVVGGGGCTAVCVCVSAEGCVKERQRADGCTCAATAAANKSSQSGRN